MRNYRNIPAVYSRFVTASETGDLQCYIVDNPCCHVANARIASWSVWCAALGNVMRCFDCRSTEVLKSLLASPEQGYAIKLVVAKAWNGIKGASLFRKIGRMKHSFCTAKSHEATQGLGMRIESASRCRNIGRMKHSFSPPDRIRLSYQGLEL